MQIDIRNSRRCRKSCQWSADLFEPKAIWQLPEDQEVSIKELKWTIV